MKTTIDIAHQNFFKLNGHIQFEEIFSAPQMQAINLEVNLILAKRGVKDPFQNGRDLWRASSTLNKSLDHRKLAGIASELVQYKPLRLGYDQYLTPPIPYPALHSLEQLSCIQGVLCGVLLCLANAEEAVPSEIFPMKAGDATFFSASYNFPWDRLSTLKGHTYLLIVYTQERALYIHQESDPHKYALKEFGYNFGDRLNDQWNPIVCR